MLPGVRCGWTGAVAGGQTPPTAAGTRCGRYVAAATRAARPVGHASGRTYHAQGGRECVRGVGSPCGTPSAVPRGGTSGGPPRAWRPVAGGWWGRGVCASGCPRTAGHGRGLASPGLVGGLRVCHPGRGRRVAVRPRGPAGSAGVPEVGRRPQQGTPDLCAGRAAPLATRRAQRLGEALSHGRWSGAGPGRRGRGGVRGPASAVTWTSGLGVGHTATATPGAWHSLGILAGCGAHRAHTPSRCAGAGQEGRLRATPRAWSRAHAAPNNALEPTPTASARASLWLLARLTASVRCQG